MDKKIKGAHKMLDITGQSNLFFFCLAVFFISSLTLIYLHLIKKSSGQKISPAIVNICLLMLISAFSLAALEYILPYIVSSNMIELKQLQNITAADPLLYSKWRASSKTRYVSPEWNVLININSLGLRSPETTYAKSVGKKRVLFLGDSFTAGAGIEEEETFCGIIRKRLGDRWEIINAGINGYGPLNELVYFIVEGSRYNPDAVFLCVYAGDLMDGIYLSEKTFDGFKLKINILRQLIDESGYRFTDYKAGSKIRKSNLGLYIRESYMRIKGTGPSGPRAIEEGRSDLSVFLKHPSPQTRELWDKNLSLIIQLSHLCRARGIEFYIVLFPAWVQVYDEDWKNIIQRTGLSGGDFDLRQPQGLFTCRIEQMGIRFLDLLPVFRAEAKHNRLHFIHDDHIDRKGHKLAAEAMLSDFAPEFSILEKG